MKNQNLGFTLVELLIVVTLIGFIGTITSQIFIINLRSQVKSELLKEVKQNGDYALSAMEMMIRNAVNISSLQCNIPSDELTITNQDGFTTTFSCTNGSKIASNTSSLTSNKVVVYNCSNAFRVVCPTPPLYPKYVFINYIIQQAGTDLTPTPGSITSLEYQSTISLRNYE